MPSEQENRQPSYPKTLGEILDQLPVPVNSDLTLSANNENLLTTTSPRANPAPTGKPLSEHGLTDLRNLAQSVSSGKLMDDKMLETLLAQHFGSSRFASKPLIKHDYCVDGGYNPTIERYEISLDALYDNEMKLFDALEFLNKPTSSEFLAKQIARLRTVMARTNESNQDLAVLVDTYADRLAGYPPDIVKAVCDKIMDNQKWFPLISEMKKEMERLMLFRRSVLNAFEECRNPLLAGKKKQKQLAADPRYQEHWKDLPKNRWLPLHFEWAIAECEDMLKLARQNPALMHPEFWEEKIDKLRSEKLAA